MKACDHPASDYAKSEHGWFTPSRFLVRCGIAFPNGTGAASIRYAIGNSQLLASWPFLHGLLDSLCKQHDSKGHIGGP
jgi:hypothetical protein